MEESPIQPAPTDSKDIKERPKKVIAKSGKSKKPAKAKRTLRPYPLTSFEDALVLADQIQKIAAGEKVRRLTLLKGINKSPTSSGVVTLITNSGKYGITTGSYAAEILELTPDGKIASDPVSTERARLQAKFKLAIEHVAPFKALYEEYRGKKIPSHEVMKDFLQTVDSKIENLTECIDLFIVNAKYLGLLQTIAGSEMILPIEQILEEMGGEKPTGIVGASTNTLPIKTGVTGKSSEKSDYSNVCFYIA